MAKRIIKFAPGEQIIKRGDIEQRMYIILHGKIEISINDGIKKVILSELGRKEFFGEISLFTRAPRTADAFARQHSQLTYLDSIEELDEFLNNNHSYSNRMVKVLAERIVASNNQLYNELGSKKSSTIVGFMW